MIKLQMLFNYVKQNEISEEEFQKNTGVSVSRLENSREELSADEFLQICTYLNVDPWLFYERKLF